MKSARQYFHILRVKKELKFESSWRNEWYKGITTGSGDDETSQNKYGSRGWIIRSLITTDPRERVKKKVRVYDWPSLW